MDVAPICQRERQMKEGQREGGGKRKWERHFGEKWSALLCYRLLKDCKKLSHICLHLLLRGHTHTHMQTSTRSKLAVSFLSPPLSVLGQQNPPRYWDVWADKWKQVTAAHTHTHTHTHTHMQTCTHTCRNQEQSDGLKVWFRCCPWVTGFLGKIKMPFIPAGNEVEGYPLHI